MNKKLIMNLSTSEKRVAILENGQAVEFIIQQPENKEIAGNIYYGKVTDVLPGMQAAFVDLGLNKNGYIHLSQLHSYNLRKTGQGNMTQQSISNYVHQGEKILVQVEKDAFGNKGPKLTGLIEIPGNNLVYLPFGNYIGVSKKMAERDKWRILGEKWVEENEGIVFRTSCEGKSEENIYKELTFLRDQFKDITLKQRAAKAPALLYEESSIAKRLLRELPISQIDEIVIDDFQSYTSLKQQLSFLEKPPVLTYYSKKENIFSHFHLEQELEKALKHIVWLNNGAYIIIEQTEAMTVIDVNTGKYAGKSNLEETVLKTNIMAAEEIARQLRLRDIGGIIIIDFIDMKNNNEKNLVLATLKRAFQHDRMRINIVGFTGLGLVELTRKKVRPNLNMLLTKSCPACSGKGYINKDEAIAYKLERELWEYRSTEVEAIWIETTAAVIHCLAGEENKHLQRLQEMLQLEIHLTKNEALESYYEIRHLGTIKDVNERIRNSND